MSNTPTHRILVSPLPRADAAGGPAPFPPLHPTFQPANPWARVAAGIVDLVLMCVAGCVVGVAGLVSMMYVLDADFDGYPGSDQEAEWIILLFGSVGGLLYWATEAFGGRTPGKRMFGLFIITTYLRSMHGGYVRRWLFKTSPLFTLACICLAGAVNAAWAAPMWWYEFGWAAGWDVAIGCAAPAIIVVIAFLGAFQSDEGQALYDRTGRTVVVRRAYPGAPRGHAFEVVQSVRTR